jgi:HSP20 family protein
MNLRSLVPSKDNGNTARTPAPVSLFGSLYRDIDRLFEEFTRGPLAGPAQINLVPSIDVSETGKEIVLTAEMPGLERGDVDISIEDDVLTIRGEKKVEQEKDDKNYHVSERAFGMFYRALQLPPGVDPSKIQATMENGVLKVAIPKPARAEPKRVEVQAPAGAQSGSGTSSRAASGSASQGASGSGTSSQSGSGSASQGKEKKGS